MKSEFEVQNHVEMAGRGTYMMGHIVSGTIRIGDCAITPDKTTLTVAAIEFADKLSTRETWVCIRFSEPSPKFQLEQWFPRGTVVEITHMGNAR